MELVPALADPVVVKALKEQDRRGVATLLGGLVTWAITTVVSVLASPKGAQGTNAGKDPRWLVIVLVSGLVIAVTAFIIGFWSLARSGRFRRTLAVSPWRRTRATYVEVRRFGGETQSRNVGIVAQDLGLGDPTVISLHWNTRFALARSGLDAGDWADVAGDPQTGFVVRGPETSVLLSGRRAKRRTSKLLIEATAVPRGSRVNRSGVYRRR
jgi:hypothetical protein